MQLPQLQGKSELAETLARWAQFCFFIFQETRATTPSKEECQNISLLYDLKLWVEGIVMIVLSLHTVWLKVQGKKA